MRRIARLSVVSVGLTVSILLGAQTLQGQDYAQYETQYLNPLPGQVGDLQEALGDHNRRFHNEGAFAARVYAVINGPRAGQLFWVMGPGTWTDWDSRPADEAHDSDWDDNVMAHARNGRVEYWRRMENLSTTVDSGDEVRPLQRLRFFSVENEGAWRRTQALQEEAGTATRSRTFYDRQFVDPDGRNFVLVQAYRSFGELDEGGGGGGGAFQRRMVESLGVGGYLDFQEERQAAGISAMDEWQQLLPELNGVPSGN